MGSLRRTRLLGVAAALVALWPVAAAAGGSKPSAAPAAGWQTLLASPAVHRPTGIAIDTRGNPKTPKWVYTADAATGRVVKFGTNGKLLGSWSYLLPSEPPTGAAVAVGGSGNVFVADPVSGAITKYSPSGTRLRRWRGFNNPQSIAVDPAGDMYIAETGAHQITELPASGALNRHWDAAAGFPQQYTVPPTPSGQLGYPTNVAIQQGGSLFVSTRCVIGTSCTPYFGTTLDGLIHPQAIDALLNLTVSGSRSGYLGDWWFGLGHTLAGTPQGSPAKETEPFVTIDRLTSNGRQTAYLAGELWTLGGSPTRGVIAYSSLGSHPTYWPLMSQSPVAGIAVDGLGRIYVAQNSHILRLDPARTRGQHPPY